MNETSKIILFIYMPSHAFFNVLTTQAYVQARQEKLMEKYHALFCLIIQSFATIWYDSKEGTKHNSSNEIKHTKKKILHLSLSNTEERGK